MQEYERLYEGVITPFGKLDLVAEFFDDYVQLTSTKHNCTIGYIENCTQFPEIISGNMEVDYEHKILIETITVAESVLEYTFLHKNGATSTEQVHLQN